VDFGIDAEGSVRRRRRILVRRIHVRRRMHV
jgi:hypothetical protein